MLAFASGRTTREQLAKRVSFLRHGSLCSPSLVWYRSHWGTRCEWWSEGFVDLASQLVTRRYLNPTAILHLPPSTIHHTP